MADTGHTVCTGAIPYGLSVFHGNCSKRTDPFAESAADADVLHIKFLRVNEQRVIYRIEIKRQICKYEQYLKAKSLKIMT